MKFYLSSFKIGNDPQQLKDLVTKSGAVLYISNALDFAAPEKRDKHREWDMQELRALGFDVEPLDLQAYFGKEEALKEKVQQAAAVYISGGNVYDLRIAMKLSGFDEIIQQTDENFVYAGYSAAVCVLSPTLRGYHIVDNPENKQYGDYETIWDGLGLIDWQFAPHFDSDHSESEEINKEIAYYKKHGMKFRALKDGEVIIIA